MHKQTVAEAQTSLLSALAASPRGSKVERQCLQRLIESVLAMLQSLASAESRRFGGKVDSEDLVGEAVARLLEDGGRRIRAFRQDPRHTRSGFPTYVATVAKKTMRDFAATSVRPIHVTDYATKRLNKARRAAHASGREIAEELAELGVSEATVTALGDGSIPNTECIAAMADYLPDEAPSPLDLMLEAEQITDLVREVASLPPAQRFVVRSTYGIDGEALANADIAAALGVTLDEVHRVRSEALAALKQKLTAGGDQ